MILIVQNNIIYKKAYIILWVINLKKIKFIIISILIVLSFFCTDKIMAFIDNKNPIMQEIIKKENNYNIKAVNAIIDGNTIIPGIKGKKINKHKSFIKMNEFGSFNSLYLVYDTIKPNISISENMDKIIISGNPSKRNISLIIEPNSEVEKYLNSKKTEYDLIANINTDLNIRREYINGETEEQNFSDLQSILRKNKLNNRLCLINYSSYDSCLKNKYYLVSATTISNNNYLKAINKISSGSIILISQNTSVANLKLILNEIQRQDLNIVYLSELIKE